MAKLRLTSGEYAKLTGKVKRKRGSKSDRLRAKFAATPTLPPLSDEEKAHQKSLFEKHDKVEYCFRLPLPPSKNSIRSIRKIPGRDPFLVPSTEYNVYKKAVASCWIKLWKGWPPEPLTGKLRVRAVVHLTQYGGDTINRDEALCDALTECGCWVDDEQVKDLHVVEGSVITDTGAIDVIVETIE
jgi:Holliday junction resolvase RusA-like endonuclease